MSPEIYTIAAVAAINKTVTGVRTDASNIIRKHPGGVPGQGLHARVAR